MTHDRLLKATRQTNNKYSTFKITQTLDPTLL